VAWSTPAGTTPTGTFVQNLDETGYAAVKAAAAADRPRIAAQQSSYSVYNTGWTTNVDDNTRLTDEYGPAHTATLKNGTTGLYRTHTHTMYDDDPHADGSLITATHGATGSASSSRKQILPAMSTGSTTTTPRSPSTASNLS